MTKVRTGGVIELSEKIGKLFPVAQRQPDSQIQPLGLGESADGHAVGCCGRHMMAQQLMRCPCWPWKDKQRQRGQESREPCPRCFANYGRTGLSALRLRTGAGTRK